MYNYRGSTSVHGISYLNRTSENDLKISIVCKNRMTEMLNICRGKKELHETPYVVVTTFFNITVPSRLDFRRLPGPVFDPPRWVWAHFPEQRLVIEPTFQGEEKHLSGFVQIFGSKIQDFFQTFFQNNYFFFQTQGYQIGDQ